MQTCATAACLRNSTLDREKCDSRWRVEDPVGGIVRQPRVRRLRRIEKRVVLVVSGAVLLKSLGGHRYLDPGPNHLAPQKLHLGKNIDRYIVTIVTMVHEIKSSLPAHSSCMHDPFRPHRGRRNLLPSSDWWFVSFVGGEPRPDDSRRPHGFGSREPKENSVTREY